MILVDLTDASTGGGIYTGQDMPPFGLGDVSEGETVYFDPGTEVTVNLPKTLPLSIFTAGQEVDGCGRILSATAAAFCLACMSTVAFAGLVKILVPIKAINITAINATVWIHVFL
jgi:hypothetical protein